MKKRIILFTVLIFSMCGLSAKQWVYVSPKGDDRNIGTRDQPLASLAGARDHVRDLRQRKELKDTVCVYVFPGDYYMKEPLKLTHKDTGTEQTPLIFTASEENRPVFYGGIKLNKFKEIKPNLWRVFIPEVARYGFYFEQLYINGERRFRAQTPNRGGFYLVRNVEETILDKPDERAASLAVQKIKLFPSDAGLLDSLEENGTDDALVVFNHNWDVSRKRIQYVNPHDTAFFLTGKVMKPWNPINNKSLYVVENYRGALDAPGEWFLKHDGYLYYIPLAGETAEHTECVVPLINKFVVIEGEQTTGKHVGHIRFENLCFRVAGYNTPVRGNEPAQAASNVEATVMLDYANHIEFLNCEMAHTGLYAMWFKRACSECRVQHCHLYDLGAGGVKIGEIEINPDSSEITNHITVDNNIIQHGGYVFPCAIGVIILQGSNNAITHNNIADFRYSGVSVGWFWGYNSDTRRRPSVGNKIEYNHIHHIGWGELSDMGAIYTLGESPGTTVSNNVIHDVYSYGYGGWGLYTDEGSTGIVIENNLVYGCKNGAFHQHYGKKNVIRNNIFAFGILSQIQFSKVENHRSFDFTNNIVLSDCGSIFSHPWNLPDVWKKANILMDRNLYWDMRGGSIEFEGVSFHEWKKVPHDINSIVADPFFTDPAHLDFTFHSTKNIRKIGFKPFDYTKAGVYGSPDWIKKAKLDPDIAEAFRQVVVGREKNYPRMYDN